MRREDDFLTVGIFARHRSFRDLDAKAGVGVCRRMETPFVDSRPTFARGATAFAPSARVVKTL
jgi:hypothetical protein